MLCLSFLPLYQTVCCFQFILCLLAFCCLPPAKCDCRISPHPQPFTSVLQPMSPNWPPTISTPTVSTPRFILHPAQAGLNKQETNYIETQSQTTPKKNKTKCFLKMALLKLWSWVFILHINLHLTSSATTVIRVQHASELHAVQLQARDAIAGFVSLLQLSGEI